MRLLQLAGVCGGLLAAFGATAAVITTPQPFAFADREGVARNRPVVSTPIAVRGINAPSAASLSGAAGASFSVNGGDFLPDARNLVRGDVVRLRLTSAPGFDGLREATLSIGGVADTWSVRTLAADTTPDAFEFADVADAAPDADVVSAPIVVGGINQPADVSVSGAASARFSINGGTFRKRAARVRAGDEVRLSLHSAANAGVHRTARLEVGGVSAAWHVTTRSGSGRWASAYYPCYHRFTLPPSEIDYSALTQLVHWPVLPNADGSLNLSCFENNLDEVHSADVTGRAHAVGTKVLLGVGGDLGSGATFGFQNATTPAHRATFVANLVNLVVSRDYDGIEINWEVIREEDEANFVGFIQSLRAALDAAGPGLLLTFVPESTRFDLAAIVEDSLDQINIQTYVMSGPYPGWVTWFNSPLFHGGFEFPCCAGLKVPSIDAIVDQFLGAGIPGAKLAISSQFDGFVWSGGSGMPNGGATGPRQRWSEGCCNGEGNELGAPQVTTMRYADIVAQFTPAAGYARSFDASAQVPWLARNDAQNGNDKFISYDDEEAIAAKAAYLRAKGLGGYFAFELRGDYVPTASGAAKHPLLQAIKTHVLEGFVNTP